MADAARLIFLRWERLRVPYNALLGVIAIGFLWTLRDELLLADPLTVVAKLLVGCLLANVCFASAPLVETYLSWLGLRTRVLTPILFAAGVAVSIPLVLLFLLAAFGWTIG